MESELKPTLIRAAQSNNESEVKKLLDGGVNVDETDDQGKTALFYAAQNDNESIAVLLIEAGADVDAKDNEDKTALFYAAANKSIKDGCSVLDALVEKGDASVNVTDIYGRTPLFYAITNSTPFTRYLLDHEANLHAEDHCNVSILTCLIEYCLMKQQSSSTANPTTFLSEVLHLLLEKGLDRQSIVESIVNLVFCKAPLLFCSNEKETAIPGLLKIGSDDIVNALTVAVKYVDENCIEKKELILKLEKKIRSGEMFEALDLLSKLRANPNRADSAGNTALHYTTILPLVGVPQEQVMKICKILKRRGVHFSKANHQSETPLLSCLSPNNWKFMSNKRSGIKVLVEVCAFLLKEGSKLDETLKSKETVFHLMMKLFQQVFSIHDKVVRENVLQELMKLLEILCVKGEKEGKQKKMGNEHIHDDSGNSPLQLWAKLILPSSQDYTSNICDNYTFEKVLKFILDSLLKCGANVNDRNNDDETPLHLCKTWTAVKLLIEAEANPKDVDSSGRSPLLVATKNKTFLKQPDRFYPDFTNDPKAFWKSALENGLDLWTADKQSESVLSALIKADASALSRALVKAATCKNIEDDTFFFSLLNTICKDGDKQWKADLVGDIIKLRKTLPTQGLEEALCLCCRNVMKVNKASDKNEDSEEKRKIGKEKNTISDNEGYSSDEERTEDELFNKEEASSSVHYKIAERLILHGANYRASSSCLEMAETCPVLKDLLSKPIDIDSISKLINNWSHTRSKRYEETLKKVSRQLETKQIRNILYHKTPIASGGFGHVFVGINEGDGREVAIKRIENRVVNEQEMKNLTRLADCEQVVRYLYYFPEDKFSYIILELMEGTLDEYLAGDIDESKSVELYEHVVMGLRFLHDHPIPIIHRDLKPANILYKTHPKLCLKIADFGLSLPIDSSSNKVSDENVGTKCWRAPEVLKASNSHSVSSDMFSCGLLLHYILSRKKHPFSQPDCGTGHRNIQETENNIRLGEMKGWDSSLSPEATHLVKWMLQHDREKRPTSSIALNHPLFWTEKGKVDFLTAVSNQPEFFEFATPVVPSAIETDLEVSFKTVVRHESWIDQRYSDIPSIYDEIKQSGRAEYDTHSLAQLMRFIGNAHAHVSSMCGQQATIEKMLLFLKHFPDLFMEVYKAVTTHGWDENRQEIQSLIHCDRQQRQSFSLNPNANGRLDKNLKGQTHWISVSKKFENRLCKVDNKQDCVTVDVYKYHKDPITSGQFGQIFAGISVNDGREVAIKRIEKLRMQRSQDKREVINLTTLADCQQVVRYLCFLEEEEEEEFSYVVLELMEGNLKEYLSGTFDPNQSIQLCQDVVMGMKYLHEHNILHRDLKPGNILYKVHPKLCLKIADFGLSRRIDSSGSSTVYSINSGTKCWIAPEVLSRLISSVDTFGHSKLSDMFSCGLVLHYILSVKRHPFSPADCANKDTLQVANETEVNIINGKMEGWHDSSPEATHLLRNMLDRDEEKRPDAEEALEHPLFWAKQKKIDFLCAVGNQPEFQSVRNRRPLHLSEVETVLEERKSTIFNSEWIDFQDENIVAIYNQMANYGRRPYLNSSVVELVRFIRNSYAHISTTATPILIKKLLLEDFWFLANFPKLLIEVYDAATTFHWSTTRDEIKYAMKK